MATRTPLTPERIVEAAVRVADAGGVGAISMRNVARELGVEAMSLYHHVPGKEPLLDALVEWVFARIALPGEDMDWREGMRVRARSAREVLAAHPWALLLLDSRAQPGPALLHHHDAVLGCLRRGGSPVALATRAFTVIDAYVYGFVLTERNLPFDAASAGDAAELASGMLDALAAYPYMVEVVGYLSGGGAYVFADEFDEGLELVLDGLAARLARA